MKSIPTVFAVLLLAADAPAVETPGDRLAEFVGDACDYLRAHVLIKPQDAQPHFGKLLRTEMITKHVASPHRRYYFEPQMLPGWEAWMESRGELTVAVPASVAITLADLERHFGDATEEDTDQRLALATSDGQPSERKYPFRWELRHLGTKKTCDVVLETDGRYKDSHKQRVLKLAIYE